MIDRELLDVLCCPEDRQPVHPAPPDVLDRVNEAIRDGRLAGRPEVTEGLVRADGKVLYPVRDGIPIMLIEDRLEIPPPTETG